MKLKAIIIDDEINVSGALKSVIENNIIDVTVVETINDSTKAPDLINFHQPDIVFIDIEMPIMNGFDVLECIQEINFSIIFVTAYDQYGIKAIKANALDYLLKPIKIVDVIQAVNKVKMAKMHHTQQQISTAHQAYMNNTILNIQTLAGIEFIPIVNIIHIEASGNYCNIICIDNKQILAIKGINEIEKALNQKVFFRPHRSHIVNLNYIKRYVYSNGGLIIMVNGKEIPLARRKKDEFKTIIQIDPKESGN